MSRATTSGPGNNAIMDWVLVELRNASRPSIVVEARAALLHRDGDLVAVDGVLPLGFCSAAGSYKVAVRHRNHLACMTNAFYTLGAVATPIDLSVTGTTTYGTMPESRSAVSWRFGRAMRWPTPN